MEKFELKSEMLPKGDQINAIKQLNDNFDKNITKQVLLGATGTGKTFTVANVISKLQTKTLVLVHNKTLAEQLYVELKELFPNNKVEYYVSYFDFYQPEAYVARTDTYIEKSAVTNQQIEMCRLSTINSLATRNDTIVVASVAAIYASINPQDFSEHIIFLKTNQDISIKQLMYSLVKLQYKRNDVANLTGTFRVRGNNIEIIPGNTDTYKIRINFSMNKINDISLINIVDSKILKKLDAIRIIPANEYIMNEKNFNESIKRINEELKIRSDFFKKQGKLVEEQRINDRTIRDIDNLKEMGYCNGIENYSRHLELREENETPYTIFDFFDHNNWLLIVDESHMTIPQIRGMYNTDKSRKENLVEYGFRLPSALDNRPLNFDEFNKKLNKVIYVSATPAEYEINDANNNVIRQIIRPTGLLDPTIEIRQTNGQINDCINELKKQISKNERTFITVLTIRMAEDLTKFLLDKGIKVAYLHNELKTLERTIIINDLRRGKYDVIVGINLLREGLDVPEVSLVMIFDADKPGLFRNEKSLIQTFGRAARNENGRVILYADEVTKSMDYAINETNERRKVQIAFNKENNIIPKTIIKPITDTLPKKQEMKVLEVIHKLSKKNSDKNKLIEELKNEMLIAANKQNYEKAASIRDYIIELESI